MAVTHPHITVGHHNRYGVVAATSHDNHVAEHILRLVGFERRPGSDLYGLSDPTLEPLRRGAQAVQSLRAAQYSVTSDAAYDLQPYSRTHPNQGLSNQQEKPSALPVSGVGETPFASAHALGTSSYVRDIGWPDPTSAKQQRRSPGRHRRLPGPYGCFAATVARRFRRIPPRCRCPGAKPHPLARSHQGELTMDLQLEPDVAFGLYADLGVAAAIAEERPFLDEVLRKHHFRCSEYLDVYLLPTDTPHNQAVQTMASASREFQESGHSVAADPKIVIPQPIPAPDGVPARSTQPAQSLTALTGQLHELRRSADVADVLSEVHDKRAR